MPPAILPAIILSTDLRHSFRKSKMYLCCQICCMNTKPFHTTNSLHDKIAEKEQAYQLAIDENKDYHFIKDIKATLDTLKKELRQMETSFHDEFKNQSL